MVNSVRSDGIVLVVGATGKLGTEVVRQLREQGWPVRAMARSSAKAGHLQALGAEVAIGDLLDRTSLARACEGVAFVVASAHAALSRGANRPRTVDGAGHRDLIDVAHQAGVRHFVYVSAMGIGPDHPVDFFRIKYETERYLESSGLSYSIVRGAAFMETQNEIVGKSFLKNGKAFIIGRGDKRNNYVSVVDVARFVALALQDERLHGRMTEVGGPENLTQTQLVDIYEKVTGWKAKRIHVPVAALRILRTVVGPFHSVARRMFTMGVFLGSNDQPFDMDDVLREFPMDLTRFEDVVRGWLQAQSGAPSQGHSSEVEVQ
jgi:uncharacterized protein YbjT (DUF2867 family)